MHDSTFDVWARQVSGPVSRRSSLLSLGGAALAASLAGSGATKAKSKRKKQGKTCKRQVAQCQEGLMALCASQYTSSQDAAECSNVFIHCCELLQQCDTAAAFACAVNALETAQEA